MQKSKQKKQHTIVQCGCDHTVQMQNENKQKKTATLFCQLCNQNNRYQRRTKTN